VLGVPLCGLQECGIAIMPVQVEQGDAGRGVFKLSAVVLPRDPGFYEAVDIAAVLLVAGDMRGGQQPLPADAVAPEPDLPRMAHEQPGRSAGDLRQSRIV